MKVERSTQLEFYWPSNSPLWIPDFEVGEQAFQSITSTLNDNSDEQDPQYAGIVAFNTNEDEQSNNNQTSASSDKDLDVTGLFPDNLLETIKRDQELHPVFQSFFTEDDSVPSNCAQESHDLGAREPPMANNKRHIIQKERFGEKRIPCKKARVSINEDQMTEDGGKMSRSK